MTPRQVFIAGGTGYMGSRLIPALLRRGHRVTALARAGSGRRLPGGVVTATGDALAAGSYTSQVRGCDTFVHLVGVAHPSPAKARQFREIDQVSARVALRAALDAGVRHFVYLSVAHPAPMMKAYIAVRSGCESEIRASGLPATFLRPWYVLGPGHRWPCALLPLYWICERIPSLREGALRLGLVTLPQMIHALLWAVEHPPSGIQVLDVPRIREFPRTLPT